MARFGEGDSRWIVQERADGSNVNNWHWSEKDCMPWAKARLGELFTSCKVLEGQGGCYIWISAVESVEGEAYVNIRKGKIIPGYEISVRMKWQGEVRDLEGKAVAAASGSVELPYISEENHDEDPEVRVGVSEDTPPAQRLHQAMLQEGRPLVRKKIAQFVEELRAGGPAREELQKRKAGGGGQESADGSKAAAAAGESADGAKAAAAVGASRDVGSSAGAPLGAGREKGSEGAKSKKKAGEGGGGGGGGGGGEKGKKTLAMTQRFHCRASDIYDVLMDEKRWMAFTQSKAEMSKDVGGAFSLFNGAVSGVNQKLEKNALIVQKWRFNSWPDGVYSMVCMTIEEPEPGNTIVKLTQSGIPEEDRFGNANVYDTTVRGWQDLVFGRIRAVFGYGV